MEVGIKFNVAGELQLKADDQLKLNPDASSTLLTVPVPYVIYAGQKVQLTCLGRDATHFNDFRQVVATSYFLVYQQVFGSAG